MGISMTTTRTTPCNTTQGRHLYKHIHTHIHLCPDRDTKITASLLSHVEEFIVNELAGLLANHGRILKGAVDVIGQCLSVVVRHAPWALREAHWPVVNRESLKKDYFGVIHCSYGSVQIGIQRGEILLLGHLGQQAPRVLVDVPRPRLIYELVAKDILYAREASRDGFPEAPQGGPHVVLIVVDTLEGSAYLGREVIVGEHDRQARVKVRIAFLVDGVGCIYFWLGEWRSTGRLLGPASLIHVVRDTLTTVPRKQANTSRQFK